MHEQVNVALVADHVEDARLSILAAMDLINGGQSGYSMSTWQLSALAALATEADRLARLRSQVVEG